MCSGCVAVVFAQSGVGNIEALILQSFFQSLFVVLCVDRACLV